MPGSAPAFRHPLRACEAIEPTKERKLLSLRPSNSAGGRAGILLQDFSSTFRNFCLDGPDTARKGAPAARRSVSVRPLPPWLTRDLSISRRLTGTTLIPPVPPRRHEGLSCRIVQTAESRGQVLRYTPVVPATGVKLAFSPMVVSAPPTNSHPPGRSRAAIAPSTRSFTSTSK